MFGRDMRRVRCREIRRMCKYCVFHHVLPVLIIVYSINLHASVEMTIKSFARVSSDYKLVDIHKTIHSHSNVREFLVSNFEKRTTLSSPSLFVLIRAVRYDLPDRENEFCATDFFALHLSHQ